MLLSQPATRFTPGRRTAVLTAGVLALRPYQWVKNLLVLVPLITSHEITDLDQVWRALIAFASFCMCASGTYVFNDLLDVAADRQHPRKRHRPFAAGTLPMAAGPVLIVGTLTVAFLAAWQLSAPGFVPTLLLYAAATVAYSLRLKKEPVLDVILLAGLYALRVFAGAIAVGVQLSAWLMAFASFLFLSLAFMKRFSELKAAGERTDPLAGRGYRPDDVGWVQSAGLASGYVAVLVLALYVNSGDVAMLYERPRALWLLCPAVLYWITRTWFRAHRGAIDDDPIVGAASDPMSYVLAVAVGLVLVRATV